MCVSRENKELNFWKSTVGMHNKPDFVGKYNEWIKITFPFHEGIPRLAIGSGPHGAFRLYDPTFIGLDIWADKYIEMGYKHLISLVQYNGKDFPFEDNEFDYIYWLNAMDHTNPDNIQPIIEEIKRVGTDKLVLYFFSDIDHEDTLHYKLTEEMVYNYFKDFDTSRLVTQTKTLANSRHNIYGEIHLES